MLHYACNCLYNIVAVETVHIGHIFIKLVMHCLVSLKNGTENEESSSLTSKLQTFYYRRDVAKDFATRKEALT